MPQQNDPNIKWFASVVVLNPHFENKHGIYDASRGSKIALMKDVVEALRDRQNSFRKYWPHPEDTYLVTPLCIKENEVLTEAGCSQRNFDDYRYTYSFYAKDLFKWEVSTEKLESEEDRRGLWDGPADITVEELLGLPAPQQGAAAE